MANVPDHGPRLTSGNPPEPRNRPDCDENRFANLFERFWDGAVSDDETERQVAVIERALRLTPGDHVLVFPTGACRLALALAAKGYKVTGIDKCPDAVERGARLAACCGSATFRTVGLDDAPAVPYGTAAICLGWPGPATELAAWLASALMADGRALIETESPGTPDTLAQALSDAGLSTLGDCADFWDEAGAKPRRVIVAVRS